MALQLMLCGHGHHAVMILSLQKASLSFQNAEMLDLHDGTILKIHIGAHMGLCDFLDGIHTQSALPRPSPNIG